MIYLLKKISLTLSVSFLQGEQQIYQSIGKSEVLVVLKIFSVTMNQNFLL